MSGATIVYIDHDPSNAELVEYTLANAGCQVVWEQSGLAGIEAALTHDPDLVLVELELPDMIGFEVSMRLREVEDFRKTPVLAITDQDDEEYQLMARIAEISGYVLKPINEIALLKKVETYLRIKVDTFLLDLDLEDRNALYDWSTVNHLLNKLREVQASNDELRANNRDLVAQLVTKLRQAEATHAALRRLDQLKDDFIQRTAHEIRTPLTVMTGYFSMLNTSPLFRHALENDQALDTYVTALSVSMERTRRVVDEVIMVSRILSGELQLSLAPVNPLVIAQSATTSYLDACAERQIELQIVAPESWPHLLTADEKMLRLVFSNLFSNAIKYTPDGGNVAIYANHDGHMARFTVEDSGIGIDPSEQDQIFERFYSLGSVLLHSTSKTAFRGGGLGVGLSICKAVVEAHGGRIYVESAGYDEETLPGSTFRFELPLNDDI